MREEHTDTEGDHIDTHDDGAHGGWEELANTTQHHDHTHRNVDETTEPRVSGIASIFQPGTTMRPSISVASDAEPDDQARTRCLRNPF